MIRIICAFFLLATGCTQTVSSPETSPGGSSTAPEIAECTTSTVHSPSVTVTGTATFYKRGLAITNSGSNVTKMTLSAPISAALPIRFAEIRVLDNSGAVIQCGKTNSTGALKALNGTSDLVIPASAGSYTIQVLSRSNHSFGGGGGKPSFNFSASVKSDLYSNQVYALSQNVNSTGSGTVSANLVAYARESQSTEISGGAFNIYNSLLTSYEYLSANTGTSDLTCLSPRLDTYWKAGFNPAQYLYPEENPSTLSTLSFYVRGSNQLFVNGGQLGDVAEADTDHFDDAVIIHELGHHLEYMCGSMDSPGGTHYGLYRADPRMTWSEGWGNFFGAHIIKNKTANINPDLSGQISAIHSNGWLYYLDTMGYKDGSVTTGDEYIRVTLNKSGNNPETIMTSNGTRYYDKVDSVQNPGEGHFRETSIARSLFKITNTCTNCVGQNYFGNIWKALEKDVAGVGMGKSAYPFRSSVRFYSRLHQSFSGSTPGAIDTVLDTDEAQQRDGNSAYTVSGYKTWVPYGIKLVPSVSACSLKLLPRQDSGVNTNFMSDQRYSNHFYYVDLTSLPGVSEIRVASSNASGTTNIDVDAILYKESYSFDEDCTSYDSTGQCTSAQKMTSTDMVRYDRTSGNGTKRIQNLTALNATNKYLLNIRAYTTNLNIVNTTEYVYIITDQSGGYLCPSSTF